MGILDEAIREHLELKRQHGAEESELEGLESEAFGPADRPDATEAQTEVISPGSSLTTPAGEGDQLDKVFEASRQAESEAETQQSSAPGSDSDATEQSKVAEHEIPAPPAPEPEATAEAAAPVSPPTPTEPDSKAPEPPPVGDSYDDEGGDAGDALQRERLTLSDHPTEHYDVDAAIAEEEEIDILSERSLSDELDRALDGPLESSSAEPVEPEPAFDDEHQGEPQEPEPEPEAEVQPEAGEAGAVEETAEPVEGDADFFDQEDPLEATPDFLEETPEHDRLWFEQKPPKDFEF